MKLHNQSPESRQAQVFAALADPTRRRIVEMLSDGAERRLSDLADAFDSTRQTVTRHLDVLAAAGITRTERRGRERLTTLSDGAFDPLRDWLQCYDRFREERLAALKTFIEAEESS